MEILRRIVAAGVGDGFDAQTIAALGCRTHRIGWHFGVVHVAKSCHLVIGIGERLDAVVRGVGEAIGAAGRIDEFRDKTVAAVRGPKVV